MKGLDLLGIKKEDKFNFEQALFYFMKEFGFNPLDEEYHLDGKKIIKRGMEIPLFLGLMKEMNNHYEKEANEMKKSRHR